MTRALPIAFVLFVAGCSSKTVDLGGDAGSGAASSVPPSGSVAGDGGNVVVAAPRVENARARCTNPPPPTPVSGGSAADVTARLSGVWFICTYTGSPLGADWLGRDNRSYAFTSYGEWYSLSYDTQGDLVSGAGSDVVDAGPAPFSGSYSFDDANGDPLAAGGDVGYVATDGKSWFKPSFSADGDVMTMNVVDGSTQTYVRVK